MAGRTLTERVKHLEGCYDDLQDEVQHVRTDLHREIQDVKGELSGKIEDLREWLGNGFSDKVATIITVKLAEHQQAEWQREREERELQLKEKERRDREYGAERDRKMKLTLSLIATFGVPLAAAIGAAVSRLFGG